MLVERNKQGVSISEGMMKEGRHIDLQMILEIEVISSVLDNL